MKYEFNFILDEKMYKQSNKEGREATKNLKKNKIIQNNIITALIGLVVSIIIFFCVSGFNLNTTALYILLLAVVLFLFYRLGRKNQTYFLKQKNYIGGNHHIIVNEKIIKRELDYCSLEYKWALIKDVLITSNCIFVVTVENKFIFIPRSVFEDYIELKKFCNFVKANINNLSHENSIKDYVKKMGGVIISIKRNTDDNTPFFKETRDKIIYKFEYKINDEIKEGWVMFGGIRADWKI